ncbi:putative cytochrome P450 [Helianthus annuus]|nr:putative cytochrome P450 [Helianthus annuus]
MFSFLGSYFLFFSSFIILVIFIWISFDLNTKKKTPPSPRKFPIIGNLHQLGLSPHNSLQALSRKHGPLMLMHFGSVPVLVASSAEAAREIMKTHDLAFSNRPKMSIPDTLLYGSKDITFSPYGEYWRQVKSIAVVHLLNNARVQSFQQIREEEMALTINKIENCCGSVIDLSEFLVGLTNNIICKVALGRTYSGMKFKDLLDRFMEVLGVFSFGNYIPRLAWIDRLSGLEDRARKVAQDFDEFLEGVVEEHMSNKRDEDKDLVDILLDVQRDNLAGISLQRDTIKAIILDIFAAGTDTTFTSLEWAISELVRHPRVMKKLQQEVTEIAEGKPVIHEKDLEKMHYLKATIKETLRLHTPIPLLIPRESTQDVKLMGYNIPSRTQVIINASAIARDPTLWEEPDEFRPERFLNSSIDFKGFHFELLPFGAGRRGCPGIQFAMVVNELALANVVHKFNLALPNGVKEKDLDMSETSGITVHKKSPLLVMATPRF